MGETAGKVKAARAAAAGTSGNDPEQIRSEIEGTRAEMSETISALEEKLDPSYIAERVKEDIRERAAEAIDSAKEAVKEAAGKAQETVMNASGVVSDFTQRAGTAAKDKSSSVVHYVKQNPAPFVLAGLNLGVLVWDACRSGQVRKSSRVANSPVKTALQENPIILGMSALAAGTIVGFAIPSSRVNKEYLAGAGGRFLRQAKSMARKFREGTGRAGRKLKHIAQEQRLMKDPAESLFSTELPACPLQERIT